MTDPILAEFRLIRMASGRSQQDVADETGVPQASLSCWERGHRPVRLDVLRRLLDVYGLDLVLVRKDEP